MQVFAHRGAKGYVSENTLAAFEKAIAMGVHGIELDVRLSRDGQLFIFHDETTERLCGCTGVFCELDSNEIANLRIDAAHQIPTLEQVLEFVNGRAVVNVELKTFDCAAPVAEIIKKFTSEKNWKNEHFLVSSFDWNALLYLRENHPEIPLGVLTETDLDLAIAFSKTLKAETLHPHYHLLTPENTRSMLQMGLRVYPWTVNMPQDIDQIKSCGVSGIITDFPDRI